MFPPHQASYNQRGFLRDRSQIEKTARNDRRENSVMNSFRECRAPLLRGRRSAGGTEGATKMKRSPLPSNRTRYGESTFGEMRPSQG